MNINKIYNEIINDREIIELYKKIEIYEKETGGWAFHNMEHIKNVTEIVSKILQDLKFGDVVITKAKIACFLHDIGAIQGKENHAERSYEYAKNYFSKKFDYEVLSDVLEAIRIHSDGFDTDNIIALALIFADKLDIKKTRISEEGKIIVGNRQYSHIDDINVSINSNCLNINFLIDDKVDINELNEYYFTKKLFKAIKSFSNKLNLKQRITINGHKWNEYYSFIEIV